MLDYTHSFSKKAESWASVRAEYFARKFQGKSQVVSESVELVIRRNFSADPSQIRWIGRFFLAIHPNQVDRRKTSS